MKTFIGLILGLLVGVYYAYAMSMLWLWFVVPLGVIPITVAHAYGLTVFKGLLFMKKDDGNTNVFELLIFGIIAATVFLATGYVVHAFFM